MDDLCLVRNKLILIIMEKNYLIKFNKWVRYLYDIFI